MVDLGTCLIIIIISIVLGERVVCCHMDKFFSGKFRDFGALITQAMYSVPNVWSFLPAFPHPCECLPYHAARKCGLALTKEIIQKPILMRVIHAVK